MLKCTTTEPYSMFSSEEKIPSIDVSKYKGISGIKNKIFCNIYLHGKIEDLAGFDIPIWLDGDFVEDFSDGVHDCEVILSDDSYMCKLYCWRPLDEGRCRINGLIVLPDDLEWVNDAEYKYINKEFFL